MLIDSGRLARPSNFMNSRILIDGIVRQTAVLIARLSTIEGDFSPLGRVAGEVLEGLASELEGQVMGDEARADLFGTALRTYRRKVGGLTESETRRGTSLWSAVLGYLSDRPYATEGEVLANFHKDAASNVGDVLEDLVGGHFLIRSVQENVILYSAPSGRDLPALGGHSGERELASLAALVWVLVFREGRLSLLQLGRLVPAPLQDLEKALELLTSDGKVSCDGLGDEKQWTVRHVLIPLAESAGWEAAILDHHRMVSNAIASKIESGRRTSAGNDEVGGTTLTFDLWRGHPNEGAVRQLLAETRNRILSLWDEVERHGRGGAAADLYQVHFYCGQYVFDGAEQHNEPRAASASADLDGASSSREIGAQATTLPLVEHDDSADSENESDSKGERDSVSDDSAGACESDDEENIGQRETWK